MSTSIRGDKGHVRLLINGQPVGWFEIINIDEAEDSQNTETYYCGRKEPETDTLMMGWSGSITGEVKNDAVDLVIQRIRDARKAGVALPQVSMIVYEEYPDGSTGGAAGATFLYTDVQLTYASRRAGGMQEKIQKVLNFKAADRRVL